MADSDDDWRVTLSVSQPQAGPEQQSASLRQAEEDIRGQVGRGIGVGAGERQIFLYAGTETAAAEAERIARDVLARAGLAAESAVHRWHPVEERWETPDVPMPRTAAEREAEHQRLVDDETAESLASGTDQWEVRVELGSHRQAVALARTLEGEGRAIVRRWKFILVGAANEDEARELAAQLGRGVKVPSRPHRFLRLRYALVLWLLVTAALIGVALAPQPGRRTRKADSGRRGRAAAVLRQPDRPVSVIS